MQADILKEKCANIYNLLSNTPKIEWIAGWIDEKLADGYLIQQV